MLVAFAGLPGTGKSTLARGLARQLTAVVLDKDPIRAALFPPGEIEYSTRQDDFCVSIILQVAGYLFQGDPLKLVFLDGRPFTRAYQVQQVVDFCAEGSYPLRFIECVCAPEIAQARLSRATARGTHVAANRGPGLYRELSAQADPIVLPHLTVDTGEPLAACLERCRLYLAQ